jgi:hypothetical protein
MIRSRILGAAPLLLLAASIVSAADEAPETHLLRYAFTAGETIRYKVEHMAAVDTRIAGNTQETKSRSASTKAWKVTEVTDESIRFEHLVEDVDMWQQSTGRQEIRYNSRTDAAPPPEYEHVAKSLNQLLAIITIGHSGELIKRESKDHKEAPDLGFGGIVVPLPTTAVEIGATWDVPDTVYLREKDGRVKDVSTRLKYRLEKVQAGVATISVKTQVLTPINDAKLESQLVQKTSSGEIKFDVDAGRVISKQLDWDETIIGFNGADSNMKYLARFTEQLIDPQVARRSGKVRK